ncbi:MAG: ribonuclease P protein component [Coriobacteriia bacterium]|nr:ribonuclease P protein component [Coriobacteriia bacterium]
MSAKHIIKSSEEISRVLKEGKRYNHFLCTIYILKTPEYRDPSGRVAYIAGKKLGNAVWRNRSKRVMRAAVRVAEAVIPGYDILVVAKKATERAGSAVVAQAIASIVASKLIK